MAQAPAFNKCRWRSIVSWLSGMSTSILSPMLRTGAVAGADGQESVAAADDGLVGVVGVEMEAAPRENAGENVSGGGDALAVLAADADCEINFGGCYHMVI